MADFWYRLVLVQSCQRKTIDQPLNKVVVASDDLLSPTFESRENARHSLTFAAS